VTVADAPNLTGDVSAAAAVEG